ncbi:hypothetical protein KC19_2G240300 [Ceratodon purpureus]|uniref:Uncharacterized protein n=1 Tax=Ceratodon purpureus TaxID=3225 RepID=A0A8T0J147_CERPU|nr:hypothetical protein KC19_2G240300 [Ceratodon purpureus]
MWFFSSLLVMRTWLQLTQLTKFQYVFQGIKDCKQHCVLTCSENSLLFMTFW